MIKKISCKNIQFFLTNIANEPTNYLHGIDIFMVSFTHTGTVLFLPIRHHQRLSEVSSIQLVSSNVK